LANSALGLGTKTSQVTPATVPSLATAGITEVFAYGENVFAMGNGKVWATGVNNGQVGNDNYFAVNTYQIIPPSNGAVTNSFQNEYVELVATGGAVSMVYTASKKLYS
jgi:hypothetical protein